MIEDVVLSLFWSVPRYRDTTQETNMMTMPRASLERFTEALQLCGVIGQSQAED